MARSTVVGNMSVVIDVDASGIKKGIDQAQSGLTRFGKAANDNVTNGMRGMSSQLGAIGAGMNALGAAGISAGAGLVAFGVAMAQTRAALDFVDELGDTAAKLHMNVEALQAYRFAAEEAGLGAADFDAAIMGLQGSVGKLLTGIGSARVKKAFDALGISKEQVASFKNVEDMLPLIADKLATVGTVAQRVAIAEKLGVRDLLPLLDQGSAKIAEFTAKARELGIVIDNQTAESMGELQRKAEVASQAIDINLKQAFLGLAPTLVSTTEALAKMAQALSYVSSLFVDVDQRTSSQLEGRKAQLQTMIEVAKKAIGRGDLVKEYQRQEAQIDAILAKRATKADKGIALPGSVSAASGVAPGDAKKSKAAKEAGLAFGQYSTPQTIIESTTVDLTRPLIAKKDIVLPDLQNNISEVMKAFDDRQQEIQDKFSNSIRGGLEAGMKSGIPGVMDFLKQNLQSRLLDGLSKALGNFMAGMSQSGGIFGTIGKIGATAMGVPGFASGTTYAPGGLAMVGERGPELVNLPRGSRVHSAGATAAMGGTVVQHFHVNAQGSVLAADLRNEMQVIGIRSAMAGAQAGAMKSRQDAQRSGWDRFA
jgi:hypothetical protein